MSDLLLLLAMRAQGLAVCAKVRESTAFDPNPGPTLKSSPILSHGTASPDPVVPAARVVSAAAAEAPSPPTTPAENHAQDAMIRASPPDISPSRPGTTSRRSAPESDPSAMSEPRTERSPSSPRHLPSVEDGVFRGRKLSAPGLEGVALVPRDALDQRRAGAHTAHPGDTSAKGTETSPSVLTPRRSTSQPSPVAPWRAPHAGAPHVDAPSLQADRAVTGRSLGLVEAGTGCATRALGIDVEASTPLPALPLPVSSASAPAVPVPAVPASVSAPGTIPREHSATLARQVAGDPMRIHDPAVTVAGTVTTAERMTLAARSPYRPEATAPSRATAFSTSAPAPTLTAPAIAIPQSASIAAMRGTPNAKGSSTRDGQDGGHELTPKSRGLARMADDDAARASQPAVTPMPAKPTSRVTIGRLEVSIGLAPSPGRVASHAQSQPMPLQRYLDRDAERGQS